MKRIFILLILAAATFSVAAAQQDEPYYDSPQKEKLPLFGLFRETYAATGFSPMHDLNKHTADVRIQLSLALRLWRMSDDVDLLGTYTQKCIWNAYDVSSPLLETSYNPGVAIAWYLNPKVDMIFEFGHESNGKINNDSRSINLFSAQAIYTPQKNLQFGGKVWYGWCERTDGQKKFMRYRGVMQGWATVRTSDNRLSFTASVNPSHWFRNYNWEFSAYYRLSNKGSFLPSLFVQYRMGYVETLLEYWRYQSFIRAGFALELKHPTGIH